MNTLLFRIGDRLGLKTNGPLVEWLFEGRDRARVAEPFGSRMRRAPQGEGKPAGSRRYESADAVMWVDCLVPLLLKIRTRTGRLEYLAPNRAQQHYARERGKRNIILKARQVGMTTYIAARLFLLTMLRPGTTTLQVAHSLESAQQIFRIVHRFYAHLPAKVQNAVITERSNVRELAFARSDSRFRVDTAGSAAAGRGLTVHHLHASEVSEWPGKPEETMAGLLAAVPQEGTVDIESTPKGLGGYFHREWQAAPDTGYVRHFFPWWVEESYRVPVLAGECIEAASDEERELVRQFGLTGEQLKFRRQLQMAFRGLRPQEYAENDVECFVASGRPAFELDQIAARLARVSSPVVVRHNGCEHEWAAPEAGRRYIIGVDTAEGRADGDFSTAQVIDAETGMQCLETAVRWPVERFAEYAAQLGRRYNDALLAVERNNHGHAVLYALRYRHNYSRLYRHGPGELDAGWPTNSSTKPQVVGALSAMLGDVPGALQSRRLLEEMRNFSYDAGGEMRAPEGMHDDLVMAMGIAYAVRRLVPQIAYATVRRR